MIHKKRHQAHGQLAQPSKIHEEYVPVISHTQSLLGTATARINPRFDLSDVPLTTYLPPTPPFHSRPLVRPSFLSQLEPHVSLSSDSGQLWFPPSISSTSQPTFITQPFGPVSSNTPTSTSTLRAESSTPHFPSDGFTSSSPVSIRLPTMTFTAIQQTVTPFFQRTGTVAGVFTAVGIIIASLIIAIIVLIRRLRRAKIAVLGVTVPAPKMDVADESKIIKDEHRSVPPEGSSPNASMELLYSRSREHKTITNRDDHSSDDTVVGNSRAGNDIRDVEEGNEGNQPCTGEEGYAENIFRRQSSALSWSVCSEHSTTILGEDDRAPAFPLLPDLRRLPLGKGGPGHGDMPRLSLPGLDCNAHTHPAYRDSMKSEISPSAYMPSSRRASGMTLYADTVRSASPVHGAHDLHRNTTTKSTRSFRTAYDPSYWNPGTMPSMPPPAWGQRNGNLKAETTDLGPT
ncbi:hypothetical protein BDZ94DRAFT_82691 [Collybia nuda]|uniref:Uncharacterized protein n=1 Tax=Collybia nuda TaxID=64659 RepID=A0A9P5XVR8_9AGAR|nr:hypothetical protein BDZ94DRAFT_82691 [Collybia nuda]